METGRTWGRAWRAAAAATVFVSVLSGTASAQGKSGAVPKNYAQLIAAKLRQMEDDTTVIQSVGITKPRERFVGLFQGTRPAVCATVVRPNIFGMSAAWYYMFYFENGQVQGFKQATPTGAIPQYLVRCEQPLTPITHLVRTKRR